MHFVYALYSDHFDKIYIGYSTDLERRLLFHNQLASAGWTIKFRPWRIVYSESFDNKSIALVREKQLKSSRGREFIRKQITDFNK